MKKNRKYVNCEDLLFKCISDGKYSNFINEYFVNLLSYNNEPNIYLQFSLILRPKNIKLRSLFRCQPIKNMI